MDPISLRIQLGAAGAGVALPAIGDPFEGGYYAGLISHTANGVATHALIVAPAATGYNGGSALQWKINQTSSSGTSSEYDGAANTANMANASHPAANYCAGLSIGGYSDWYLPARYELEIAYYNLKPTADSNATAYGTNPYSVPRRNSNYTAGNPAQTSLAAFQAGGNEAIIATVTWSSTDSGASHAWFLHFAYGISLGDQTKNSYFYVRAFRKLAL